MNNEKQRLLTEAKREKRRRFFKRIKDLKKIEKKKESVTSAGRG